MSKTNLKQFFHLTGLLCLISFLASCGMQSIPTALNEVDATWAEVQNQYKRRADLIPNLVNVVKGYAKHEEETLTKVIEARSKATQTTINANDLNEQNMGQFSKVQGELSSALSRLMVVVEKYPDLKADQNFRDLMHQLEGTENRITIARNRYIEAIKNFNNLVTVPPTSWYNSFFLHHEKKPQFEVANLEEVQNAPAVNF
jgi:LemA protein